MRCQPIKTTGANISFLNYRNDAPKEQKEVFKLKPQEPQGDVFIKSSTDDEKK